MMNRVECIRRLMKFCSSAEAPINGNNVFTITYGNANIKPNIEILGNAN